MTDTTYTFRVDAGLIEVARDNFAKLTKRAAKLGVPPATMAVSDLVEETHRDDITGRTKVVAYYNVTVSVEPVKLAGWTLVAALDHLDEGVLVRVVPDLTVPESYRTAAANCDHCRISRKRNTTYVLQHEDGRYTQIGSTCLHDFLGLDPTRLIAAGTYLRAVASFGEDLSYGGVGGHSNRHHTASYLALVARLIQKEGWVSRKQAKEDYSGRLRATADSAFSVIYLADDPRADSRDRREAQALIASVGDTHRTLAAEALAWIRAKQGEQGLSDYFYNLTVLTAGESFDAKYGGIIAALVPTYQRELGREVERKKFAAAAALSTFVGTPGKRMDVTDLTVTRVHTSDSNYGVRSLVLMADPAGNRYKWWTGETDLAEGDVITGKGTVKEHEVYKDVKYTVLTRVAWTKQEVASA